MSYHDYDSNWPWESAFPRQGFPLPPEVSPRDPRRPRMFDDWNRAWDRSYSDDGPMPKYRRTNYYDHSPSPSVGGLEFAEENRKLRMENEDMKRKMEDCETTIRVLMEKSRELEEMKKKQEQEVKHRTFSSETKYTQTKQSTVPLEKYNRLKLKCQGLETKHAQLSQKIVGLKISSSIKTPEPVVDVGTQILEELLTEKMTEIDRLNKAAALKEKEAGQLKDTVEQLNQSNSYLNQEIAGFRQQTSHLEVKLSTLRAKQEAQDVKSESAAKSTISQLTEENSQLLAEHQKLTREKETLEEANRDLTDENAAFNTAKPEREIKREFVWDSDLEKNLAEMQGFVLERDEQLVQLQQTNARLMQQIHELQQQTTTKSS